MCISYDFCIISPGKGSENFSGHAKTNFLRNFDEQTSLWVAICQGRKLSLLSDKMIIQSGGDLESFNLNTLEHVVPDQLSHSYAIAFLRRVDITILVA